MLDHAVQDTANTEGGLDDIGGVLAGVLNAGALLNVDEILVKLNLARSNALDVDLDLAILGKVQRQLLAQILGERLNGSLDGLGILLETRTELLLLDIDLVLLNAKRLSAGLAHHKRGTGLVLVDSQIVSAAVSTADTLNPAVAGLQLSIPAVGGVVSHLVSHVLAETELGGVNAQLHEEGVDASQEVTKSLVVNQSSLNGLANGHGGQLGAARKLDIAVKQRHFNILDLLEASVLLATLRVDIVLNLCHEELTDTQETSAGRDLVTERLANGSRSEGHGLLVELQELGEVQELTLSGLGAQVARHVAAGTDGGLEHEVERDRRQHLAAGDGVADVVLLDEGLKLGATEVVNLCESLLVFLDESIVQLLGLSALGLSLLLGFLLFVHDDLLAASLLVALKAVLKNFLNQVVSAEDLASLGVLAHPVGELVHVPTGLENFVGVNMVVSTSSMSSSSTKCLRHKSVMFAIKAVPGGP